MGAAHQVSGLGLRSGQERGSGFRVSGLGFRVQVEGLGFILSRRCKAETLNQSKSVLQA